MRKKAVLIGLIVACFFFGVLCYRTWLFSFAATRLLSGPKDGRQGVIKSIIIPCRNYQVHLHHWLLALIIGAVCVAKGIYVLTPDVFCGLLSGIAFQGIYCYDDWYRIVKKRKAPPTLTQHMFLATENDTGV